MGVMRNDGEQVMDSDRKETLIQLESTLQTTETDGVTLQGKSEEKEGELKKLVEGIEELFGKIGCDDGPIQDMLGEKSVNVRLLSAPPFAPFQPHFLLLWGSFIPDHRCVLPHKYRKIL